jgi:thiamine biosynthesis lipoprotein
MQAASFDTIGTTFTITVWDRISKAAYEALFDRGRRHAGEFDALYSRFKSDSLVSRLSTCVGMQEVPPDLVAMLRLYKRLNTASGGAVNPAVGFALSDTGYDASYTLREKGSIRPVPAFDAAVAIVDDTHIEFLQPVLLDLGAVGKGYLVDLLYADLRAAGIRRFLIDGSGDIRYHAAEKEPIVCALEHPLDPSMAIGTLSITEGSVCASAINRRAWGRRNHYFDPHTQESPKDVCATWVYAESAALADGLSTALFFAPPGSLAEFSFEYCIVNAGLQRKNSAGFAAEFFAV